MTKDQIRTTMRKMNLSIGLGEQTVATHNIFSTIEINQYFTAAKCVAIYVALPDEPSTLNIINRWHKMGKLILLPRVTGDTMDFVEYSPNELRVGAFGILEPTSDLVVDPSIIDLMIVPGVAFCKDGRRLGRGKGYYDKYLTLPNIRAYTIGVGYAHQLIEEIPCEPHDIKLSEVITPTRALHAHTIPYIITKIIDAAGDAATKLGFRIGSLLPNGVTWVLSRLSVQMYKEPTSLDRLEIDTWIEDCRRIASTRNFTISNSDGELIGVATSQWCLIDMKARRPIDLSAAEIDYTRHVKPREIIIDRPRKIPQLEGENIQIKQYTTTELDIDMNNHVNTMRYIDMMLSMVDYELLSNFSNSKIDIHFISESLLGDTLAITHKKQSTPNGIQLLFEINRTDGSPSVRALFDYLN